MIYPEDSIYTSTLEVDLPAIRNNFKVMSDFAAPEVKKLAVIKANGYGLGAVEIARYLDEADCFAVANIGEALELRKSGISKEILVFSSPLPETISLFEKYSITPVISSKEQLALLSKDLPFHIQFDTGMRRFGVLPEQIDAFLNELTRLELSPSGLLTHFANSGDPNDESVYEQLKLFKEICAFFPDTCVRHCANSGAIAFYPETHLDMIRIGVSLYGFQPGETALPDLKTTARWKSKIIHTKPVKKGEGIGYSWTFKAPENGFIGLLPIGYADGLKRELGNQIQARIGDDYLPVVGRVTMDYTTVFSLTPITLGEEVELIGDGENSVYAMAAATRTIPYEIITTIGERRVKRTYRF
ncbi:alanine racemase [bacterium]|nr:MAG: alanine racemase [bacterium]